MVHRCHHFPLLHRVILEAPEEYNYRFTVCDDYRALKVKLAIRAFLFLRATIVRGYLYPSETSLSNASANARYFSCTPSPVS